MNIFEQASRLKLTFSTNKGQLSVEHLWDLSLDSLDTLAKGVNRELKASEEEAKSKQLEFAAAADIYAAMDAEKAAAALSGLRDPAIIARYLIKMNKEKAAAILNFMQTRLATKVAKIIEQSS